MFNTLTTLVIALTMAFSSSYQECEQIDQQLVKDDTLCSILYLEPEKEIPISVLNSLFIKYKPAKVYAVLDDLENDLFNTYKLNAEKQKIMQKEKEEAGKFSDCFGTSLDNMFELFTDYDAITRNFTSYEIASLLEHLMFGSQYISPEYIIRFTTTFNNGFCIFIMNEQDFFSSGQKTIIMKDDYQRVDSLLKKYKDWFHKYEYWFARGGKYTVYLEIITSLYNIYKYNSYYPFKDKKNEMMYHLFKAALFVREGNAKLDMLEIFKELLYEDKVRGYYPGKLKKDALESLYKN